MNMQRPLTFMKSFDLVDLTVNAWLHYIVYAEEMQTWSADRPSLRQRASMLDLMLSGPLGEETEAPLPCLTLIWLSLGLWWAPGACNRNGKSHLHRDASMADASTHHRRGFRVTADMLCNLQ